MEDEDQIVDRLETSIRHYLAANPSAADTAEGIARWWLVPSSPPDSPDLVERALDRLVGNGELERLELFGGTILYRRR